jgi:hypothetical protein
MLGRRTTREGGRSSPATTWRAPRLATPPQLRVAPGRERGRASGASRAVRARRLGKEPDRAGLGSVRSPLPRREPPDRPTRAEGWSFRPVPTAPRPAPEDRVRPTASVLGRSALMLESREDLRRGVGRRPRAEEGSRLVDTGRVYVQVRALRSGRGWSPTRGLHPARSRRRPTLPGGLPPSTIGAGGLNCRVRNGNGCFPAAMATGNRALGCSCQAALSVPKRARASSKPSAD